MTGAAFFVRQRPRAYRIFRVVYLALALNFLVPAASYAVAPHLALATVDRINRALGGAAIVETGRVWHMLAVGNVATLGVMCLMLLVDLRRFYPALGALAFLKGFSAMYSLVIAIGARVPVFYAIFFLDAATTAAMVVTATRARRALDQDAGGPVPPRVPWWAWMLLPRPRRIAENLERIAAAGLVPRAPTLWQVFLGTVHVIRRLVFRSETIGTSAGDPVRQGWRARLLHYRAFRLPFLLAERVVAPFDLSGLASDADRIQRHLLGAHHDGLQFVYDLELLRVHPGALAQLRDLARAIVTSDSARARWLRDLVVFEGYHERLLAAVEAALAGELAVAPADRESPDITLAGWLGWCARQPASPLQSLHALRRLGGRVRA